MDMDGSLLKPRYGRNARRFSESEIELRPRLVATEKDPAKRRIRK